MVRSDMWVHKRMFSIFTIVSEKKMRDLYLHLPQLLNIPMLNCSKLPLVINNSQKCNCWCYPFIELKDHFTLITTIVKPSNWSAVQGRASVMIYIKLTIWWRHLSSIWCDVRPWLMFRNDIPLLNMR